MLTTGESSAFCAFLHWHPFASISLLLYPFALPFSSLIPMVSLFISQTRVTYVMYHKNFYENLDHVTCSSPKSAPLSTHTSSFMSVYIRFRTLLPVSLTLVFVFTCGLIVMYCIACSQHRQCQPRRHQPQLFPRWHRESHPLPLKWLFTFAKAGASQSEVSRAWELCAAGANGKRLPRVSLILFKMAVLPFTRCYY